MTATCKLLAREDEGSVIFDVGVVVGNVIEVVEVLMLWKQIATSHGQA